MPLYICNAKRGVLDGTARQNIAQAITDIHCEVTNAPPSFVQVAFFEEAPQFPLEDKALYVRGTIRKGRSERQMQEIAAAIGSSLEALGGVSRSQTAAKILETPASWVMEGGDIMPEPGEEAQWFAAQEARRADAT